MCEPYHSIKQFPDDGPRSWGIKQFAKKIGRWLHLSRMGSGHSGAMMCATTLSLGEYESFILPDSYDYEVAWWERIVRNDGQASRDIDAMAAAKTYADKTSIGSLHALRQFLKESIFKSSRSSEYLHQFSEILVVGERRKYHKKLKYLGNTIGKINKQINMVLGYTRKRGLLVPEWADDAKLWS
jgi:hypothetical protein